MKEAIVYPDGSVTIQDAAVPTPGPREVLVKVVIAGTNPKDWKWPTLMQRAQNSGDDVAGTVQEVGSHVCEFRKGDRVAGMHKYSRPHGAFAEYAIVSDSMLFHVPAGIGFEEAATIPLAALTAGYGLFHELGLPAPWDPPRSERTALIVYGASTAVGAFAIKLARAVRVHPIVAVGSSNSVFVQDYLDEAEGDALIDYRRHTSNESLATAIRDALADAGVPDGRALLAFDGVSTPDTYDGVLSRAMAGEGTPRAKIVVVLPVATEGNVDDENMELTSASCGQSFQGEPFERRFSLVFFRMLTDGLRDGWLRGHPYEVKSGGLEGVEAALREHKEAKVRAKKLLLSIGETPGLESQRQRRYCTYL
ncbi:hypothetical protein XA68_17299 [Ophiocordyceps unilateralis]|uniref:Enoyl reductase (ER) domain-containing protein n=1 Tax=Ophiocordyceps unilateralis TaxID=268505 RepID=A0A2A9PJE9_OPHUN|nr:hypothetical protein XA68_17299 [Ophiocordyceps unilateralis]